MVKQRIPEGEEILDDEEITMEEYSKNCLTRESEYRKKVRYIIEDIRLPQGAEVLQIGPGPDWMGIWLAQERPDISLTGVEPSEDMIRVATANRNQEGISEKQIQYVQGVVEDLSRFGDSTFDMVFSNDSLHHWVDPIQSFKEINRILKETGGFCIFDERRDLNIRETLVVEVFGRIAAGKWLKYWKSSIDASYTVDELNEMLDSAGIHDWNAERKFLEVVIKKSSQIQNANIIL
ncbi:MAG: class I SAM-dependent methyltransferase [Candidatus Thorarchaeota archaeon]|nr:class I SAM-dependent methyltransferase [Candidatus Thorarchaeota archaeon]